MGIREGQNYMSKIKFILYFLTGMFVVVPILEWLGMPSFANVLFYLFGEPDKGNKIIVLLFLFIFLIALYPFRKNKKTS